MISGELRLGLTPREIETVRKVLGREPNETEWAIIDAEWSEHSSYKSSKKMLKLLPTTGRRVLLGPGYDAGVVDVGNGYVITLHIESHNHPSAVDPYGGAATGIGGVLRDILSMGSRPVALLDMLRFGDVARSNHARWLFTNVVRGIADYGNCVGVPTVAGDVEFDESFERNCLVDVACVGLARKEKLILGESKNPGDVLVLIGGSTGRDGVGGASFASKNLTAGSETERSSVQVPAPFTKKLLIDAILEAAETGLIGGMKDLGGGGLSTALSELASKGGTGVDVELTKVRTRHNEMTPAEIMTSESQERMILVLAPHGSEPVLEILKKYDVPHDVIGRVTAAGSMKVRVDGKVIADLPVELVTGAPLIPWGSKKPNLAGRQAAARPADPKIASSLLALMSSPNIADRSWVYRQYDHEVGTRTVVKPGDGDASLLRMPNGRMLAVKADGNSKHSSLDPRSGGAGCVAEACRNVVAVGAEPIAMVDHLQFGDPSDPEVYWSFQESVEGIADYCSELGLPVVGGKVSFYNEDSSTKVAIKPSPIAMVVGLDDRMMRPMSWFAASGESIFAIGRTKPELGGSEYFESVLRYAGGSVPKADPAGDKRLYRAVLKLVKYGLAAAVHDCSKGGLAVALAEMCIPSAVGASIDLARVPADTPDPVDLLFSESHGRFVLSSRDRKGVEKILKASGVPYSMVGRTEGKMLQFSRGRRRLAAVGVGRLAKAWRDSLPEMMD